MALWSGLDAGMHSLLSLHKHTVVSTGHGPSQRLAFRATGDHSLSACTFFAVFSVETAFPVLTNNKKRRSGARYLFQKNAAPKLWTNLPDSIQKIDGLEGFLCVCLKTHPFLESSPVCVGCMCVCVCCMCMCVCVCVCMRVCFCISA